MQTTRTDLFRNRRVLVTASILPLWPLSRCILAVKRGASSRCSGKPVVQAIFSRKHGANLWHTFRFSCPIFELPVPWWLISRDFTICIARWFTNYEPTCSLLPMYARSCSTFHTFMQQSMHLMDWPMLLLLTFLTSCSIHPGFHGQQQPPKRSFRSLVYHS